MYLKFTFAINKLESNEIHGCILKWLSSYLYARKVTVTIGDVKSETPETVIGITQGIEASSATDNIGCH